MKKTYLIFIAVCVIVAVYGFLSGRYFLFTIGTCLIFCFLGTGMGQKLKKDAESDNQNKSSKGIRRLMFLLPISICVYFILAVWIVLSNYTNIEAFHWWDIPDNIIFLIITTVLVGILGMVTIAWRFMNIASRTR